MRTASVSAMSLLSAVALLGACDNPDPLSPAYAARSGAVAAPSNLVATPYSYELINLAWQDNANNEAGFEVWRSTTGPTGAFTLFASYSSANTTEGGNSGLQPLTQYCYEVRAYNLLGQSGKVRGYSDFSNVACATTKALPVPAAASQVSAAPLSGGSAIRVGWTDNSADESGFRVERAAASSGPWTTVGTLPWPNNVSFYDWQPPAAEQPACYRVFAVNNYGDSPSSNVACTAIPAAASNLVATASGSNVDLTWTDNSSVEDGFQVLRGTGDYNLSVVATLPANANAFHDPALADNTYYYRVLATKDGGTSRESNTASAVVLTAAPPAPSPASAGPGSSNSVNIYWYDNSANEDGFHLYRSNDGGASWTPVEGVPITPNLTGWSESGLPSEQQVCYRVTAFNTLGESPPSNTACTTPPGAPTGLVATAAEAGSGAIDLSWADNSGVEDGYQVLRLTLLTYCDYYYCYDYYDYVPIATLAAGATSYRDSGRNPGESQSYVVVALKDGGQSDRSNEAVAIAP
jgi:hypothetical protein